MIELQKNLLIVEQKILNTGDLNECKVIPIGPILYESFYLYNFVVSLLQSLSQYGMELAVTLVLLFRGNRGSYRRLQQAIFFHSEVLFPVHNDSLHQPTRY